MDATTTRLLAVLAELVDEPGTLSDCYDTDPSEPDDAPLDQAVAAWAAAGCPDVEIEIENKNRDSPMLAWAAWMNPPRARAIDEAVETQPGKENRDPRPVAEENED